MSRAYQIRAAQTLVHHVRVEDGIEAKLELLGILPPERTAALLGEELEKQGFLLGEDGVARKTVEEGIEVAVTLSTGTVKVTAKAESEVTLAEERTARTYEERKTQAEAQLQRDVEAALQRKAADQDEAARQVLTDRLERVLAEVKPVLDAVTDAVTRGSLKEKAGQLGEIIEVAENDAGELTIRVRV